VFEFAFQADAHHDLPVWRQLADYLRGLIETNRLPVGERLPPTRALAAAATLSRGSVTQAYLHLHDLGLLTSHVGRGTYVASAAANPSHRGRTPRPAATRLHPREFAWNGLLAKRTQSLPPVEILQHLQDGAPFPFDFRGGGIDPGSFPKRAVAQATARAIERHGARLLTARDPLGWPPLRAQIARTLIARGIRCDPDDVAIVSGAQHALDLIGRVLIDPGDTVVLEEPGYFGARTAWRAAGAHLVGVRVDNDGLRTDDLARVVHSRRVKLIYTTPAVQNPTGARLSPERALQLRQVADTRQIPLVEDDYDAELRGATPTYTALKATDEAGQIIYVGTFSKALAPGLRVGYVVAARPLLARIGVAHLVSAFHTATLLQATISELLRNGTLERHVRRVRRLYADRLAALDAALRATMPQGAQWQLPAGGNALWITLPPTTDAAAVRAAARKAGIACDPGAAFFLDPPGPPSLYLSIATLSESRILEGGERLARIVRDHCRSVRSGRKAS
jgi:DNA-binding transcriptional MocR family regulator